MTNERKTQESQLVQATREHFIQTMAEGNPIHDFFPHHVREVEKWALKILDYYPDADKEILLLSVWLHDIGHSNKENIPTHELFSEKEAIRFLTSLEMQEEKIERVAHCVRTHRCREDAMPESDEAIILAAADSASHMTDIPYVYMLNDGQSKEFVLAKIERDFRDVQSLPKPLLDELTPLYIKWKELIKVFPE